VRSGTTGAAVVRKAGDDLSGSYPAAGRQTGKRSGVAVDGADAPAVVCLPGVVDNDGFPQEIIDDTQHPSTGDGRYVRLRVYAVFSACVGAIEAQINALMRRWAWPLVSPPLVSIQKKHSRIEQPI